MSDFLATALGLAFTLVVCLLAVHALLGPWLRLRRAPASVANQPDAQKAPRAAQPHDTRPRDTRPVHTA
jgi:hypothetical protein